MTKRSSSPSFLVLGKMGCIFSRCVSDEAGMASTWAVRIGGVPADPLAGAGSSLAPSGHVVGVPASTLCSPAGAWGGTGRMLPLPARQRTSPPRQEGVMVRQDGSTPRQDNHLIGRKGTSFASAPLLLASSGQSAPGQVI
ncbi:hypothetical protein ACT29H_03465 [Thermophagus sp. OGC60D27]|uniref:hypothetical protein n=1 Tax=Thermophagus sp. OGC60D27 TaxID=3458415 RepID=UPI004037B2C2